MYMNVKPNQHKIISFDTTTMTLLAFRGPPKIGGGGGGGGELLPCNYLYFAYLSRVFIVQLRLLGK